MAIVKAGAYDRGFNIFTQVIDTTNATTGLTGIAIECSSDAVVSVMTGFDELNNAVDFKTVYNLDNLKAGYIYYIKPNNHVAAITLTSGTVNVHQI
jgi:hypothetical protein